MSTSTDDAPVEAKRGSHLPTRILAVPAATVAALATWAIAGPLAGVDIAAHTGSGIRHIGPGSVVVAGVVAGLAGWALLAALERFTRRASGIWTAVALAVLVLSLAGPLGSGTTVAAASTLAALHLVVGAVLIPALARSTTERPRP